MESFRSADRRPIRAGKERAALPVMKSPLWLAQPANSRLFVPAQQNAGLGSSLAHNFILLRVLGSRGKSKKAHGGSVAEVPLG